MFTFNIETNNEEAKQENAPESEGLLFYESHKESNSMEEKKEEELQDEWQEGEERKEYEQTPKTHLEEGDDQAKNKLKRLFEEIERLKRKKIKPDSRDEKDSSN